MRRSFFLLVAACIAAVAACSQSDKAPALDVVSGGGLSPCERSGNTCAYGGSGCVAGRMSAGGSLGCEGDNAVCCIPAPDAGDGGGSDDADAAAAFDAGEDAGEDVGAAASDAAADGDARTD